MNRSKGVRTFAFTVRYSTGSTIPVVFEARTKVQAAKIARSIYGNRVEALKESHDGE